MQAAFFELSGYEQKKMTEKRNIKPSNIVYLLANKFAISHLVARLIFPNDMYIEDEG